MEITKEQVLDIYDNHFYVDQKLQEWFPEAFKFELEVGKVYKFIDKFMFKFAGKYSTSSDSGSYGFSTTGKWSENLGVDKDDKYTEATREEWQSALIQEAKRRGLYDAKCFKHANTLTVNNGAPGFVESIDKNKIWTKYGCVYHKGVWAEIIKTFSKEEAEKLLGGKII